MSAIRAKDTSPEMTVRRSLHADGFRFRIHSRALLGKPDITLPKYHAVVFVNGCFWHGHECSKFRWPLTRREFWRTKIQINRDRDARVHHLLREDGWRIATVWECALRSATLSVEAMDDLKRWIESDQQELELAE